MWSVEDVHNAEMRAAGAGNLRRGGACACPLTLRLDFFQELLRRSVRVPRQYRMIAAQNVFVPRFRCVLKEQLLL